MNKKTALIFGASRGIGLALVQELAGRGYRVIATERSTSAQLHAFAEQSDGAVEIHSADVTDPASYASLLENVGVNALDILMMNAGVKGPADPAEQTLDKLTRDNMADIIHTNATGPTQAALALLPGVKNGGVVGMMSTHMASLKNSPGGLNLYRVSKAAQNLLARSLSEQHAAERDITVLSLHPGWVQTEMGGPNAPLTVEDSARGLADQLEADRPREHVFIDYNGDTVAW